MSVRSSVNLTAQLTVATYRDEIVVLRTQRLGEADRIITALGKSRGKIRAVAKGVRKTGSRFGARLEPFMVADVQFYVGKSLDTVQQAETLGAYGSLISADYEMYTAAHVMVETADKLTDSDASLAQYSLLVGGLKALATKAQPADLILDSYLLRALSIAGWEPTFSDCAVTGEPGPHTVFIVQAGGVVSDSVAPPGAPRLRPDTVALLRDLHQGDWFATRAASVEARNEARGIVAAYVQYHLERAVKSFKHIERSVL